MQTSGTAASGARKGLAQRIFSAIDRGIGVLELLAVGGGVLLMALLMVTNVLGRLTVGKSLPGATEVTEILILILTFVGLSYGVRCARHISMSAIYDQLAGKLRKGTLVLIAFVTGALMFYLAWEALGYVTTIYQRGRQTSALQIPLWTVYAILPAGFFLASVQYWLTALRNLTTEGIYRSFNDLEVYTDVPEAASAAPEEEPPQPRGEGRGHL